MTTEYKRITFDILKPFLDIAVQRGCKIRRGSFREPFASLGPPTAVCPLGAMILDVVGQLAIYAKITGMGYGNASYLNGFWGGFDGWPREEETRYSNPRDGTLFDNAMGYHDGVAVLEACVANGYMDRPEPRAWSQGPTDAEASFYRRE